MCLSLKASLLPGVFKHGLKSMTMILPDPPQSPDLEYYGTFMGIFVQTSYPISSYIQPFGIRERSAREMP
ncbi:hypothetical protein TNCV_4640631 [Trichonephila clavipes]|nr:hypothetical protein TNCV_4640631 [Trichonephila clavipes]